MPPRAPRLSASARRAQLIDVGRSVFARRGYEGASVEEIALRAKVSKPVVYEHFGGKEGLYAVVVDREMEYVLRRITEAIAQGSPRDRASAGAVAFLTYVRDHPDGFAVLAQDAPAKKGAAQMTSLLFAVAERVTGVFASTFKQHGYDPKLAPIYAHALVGMVTFVGQWWMSARRPPVEEVAAHLEALVWMGLRHLPARPARVATRS